MESSLDLPIQPHQERIYYPPIHWTTLDKPLDHEDYYLQRKGTADGIDMDVVFVADGRVTEEKIAGEAKSKMHARLFCNDFAKSLLAGNSMEKARIDGETAISSEYYSDDEAQRFQNLIKRPISVFDGITKPEFALSGTRIIYPVRKDDKYSAEIVNHRDCFTAALIPSHEHGRTIYQVKVYPLVPDGFSVTAESFPPGSILLIGSDGSIPYIARYARRLYFDKYKASKETRYGEISFELSDIESHLGRSYEDDKQGIEKLLTYLTDILPVDPAGEEEWIYNLKHELSREIDRTSKPNDDVTLMLASLPEPITDAYIRPLPSYDDYLESRYDQQFGFVSQEKAANIEKISDLVATVDCALIRRGNPREYGGRINDCDRACKLLRIAGKNCGMDVRIFDILDLNRSRGIDFNHSFRHMVAVVTEKSGKRSFVDLTFCQYMNPKNSMIEDVQPRYGVDIQTGHDIHHPLAQRLYRYGFFDLTEENLNKYLDMTANRTGEKLALTSLDNIRSSNWAGGNDTSNDIERMLGWEN